MLEWGIGYPLSVKMLHPVALLLTGFHLFLSGCTSSQWGCIVVKRNGDLAQHNGKSVVLIIVIKH